MSRKLISPVSSAWVAYEAEGLCLMLRQPAAPDCPVNEPSTGIKALEMDFSDNDRELCPKILDFTRQSAARNGLVVSGDTSAHSARSMALTSRFSLYVEL